VRLRSVNADAHASLLCCRAVSARAAASAALVACLFACGPGGPAVGGARSFAEIDVPAATRSLAEDDARLVQSRVAGSRDPRIDHAAIVGPDDAVPDAWLHESRPIVVIAQDDADARRLAARLLRLGASRVSVVRGGIEAWSRSAQDRAPSDTDRVGLSSRRGAKPFGPEPARRMDPWQQSQK
jgi:rhodanese-related sulfurtransferase